MNKFIYSNRYNWDKNFTIGFNGENSISQYFRTECTK